MAEPDREREVPRRVGVREFRANVSDFLRQAQRGHSFVIASRGEILAELRPPSTAEGHRQPGALRGRIRMAPDFDALPADVLAAIESEV